MSDVSTARAAAGGVASLALDGVTKSFGPVQALKGVSLQVGRHEVLGLIGENGAGKSTLLKILSGVHEPDAGTLMVAGRPVRLRSSGDAAAAGIGIVHQEQSLLVNQSVAENIAMAAQPSQTSATRFGFYRWGEMNRSASAVLARIGVDIDPRTRVGDLSFVERQMVEIARALQIGSGAHHSPVLILDEPTSLLERDETEVLEREIRALKDVGSVIFVSHRLDEVRRICDRVVVMRHGEVVGDRPTSEVTEDELFQLMVGRAARPDRRTARTGASAATGATGAPGSPRPAEEAPSPVLDVEGLTRRGSFRDVSFSVAAGRALAIVGTNGSGREAVCRAVFGAEPFDAGTVRIDGRAVGNWTVNRAVRAGVGYLPSERRVEGMVGGLTAAENLTLTHPGASRVGPFLKPKARTAIAGQWFEDLDVRPRQPTLALDRFSGGNQQKVVLAKWLSSRNLKVMLLDHPLRGLDPGACEVVNAQIEAACSSGTAVVLLPDTLEEALELADEVIVMRDGDVTARFDMSREAPTALSLLEKMV